MKLPAVTCLQQITLQYLPAVILACDKGVEHQSRPDQLLQDADGGQALSVLATFPKMTGPAALK